MIQNDEIQQYINFKPGTDTNWFQPKYISSSSWNLNNIDFSEHQAIFESSGNYSAMHVAEVSFNLLHFNCVIMY